MRGIRVNTNGPATKGLAELNHHIRDEKKEVRDGIAGEGHGLSEEDESKINEDGEDANRACKELVRPLAVQQRPQQQPQGPQGPVVCWERFLPLRSLKVLLVENDDSTRHVVSALLRNCSYEVSSVATGLEAWKILEDSTTNIDLVLTEVAVPCLSGIGLLGKIMSHKNCMNIPVIMMSSNDSIGIVFKCLSKGAVDFLVKPIRKNELKNLWQHVWRKCHSSSGSGSESGIRTQKYSKIKSVEASDNNTDSYDEDDNTSIGLNVRDGSDNGSGTQSSWTKRAVEVDSPQPVSPWDQLADPPDSTCAQDIHSRPEAFSNNWVPITVTRKCHGQDDELDNVAIGKDLEIGVPRNPDLQVQDQSKKVSTALVEANKEKLSELESRKDGEKLEQGKLDINSGTRNGELTKEVDLTVTITNCTNPQMESVAIEVPTEISKTNIKDKAIYDTNEIPSLELSLKSVRDVGEIGTSAQERNVLRHSDLSAFSRYNTATANQAPTGNVGSCSPVDNISEAAKTESIQNLQSNSNGTPNQLSNGSSNNNDMGSTTNNAFTKPAAFTDKPMLKSAVNIHPCSAFQPVQNSHGSSLQSVTPGKADDAAVNTVLVPARGAQPQVQVQHHHHHYHHHHHHVHNMQQKQQQNPKHDDLSVRTMVAAAPHCGPSNVLSTPIEGNAANYSLTGSASGSNNGSNGQNGSSAAVVNEGTNMASDDGVAEKSGAGGDGGSGSGSRSGVDQNRFTQREAALNKFRLKRKDRCFEKKVRYQSRKRLAEQRPRVRGQFVRQVMYENESKDKDS
ncbi:Two-component response regulator-like [Actinidia chinensis var. chinensis]|uniref:Two-component response regulator-like n=1 Tax=Actinidia chinensis var. chinensis TaxID=1590841 RepID=A0A2R6RX24_ACTCC|nr:Two-component response regulator-like [Actinidia chinensis var. chinensis]